MLPLFVFLLLIIPIFCSPCKTDFGETVCENFKFSPELILSSATNKLTIRNSSGIIIHENFAKLTNVTEMRILDSQIEKIEPGSLCCTSNLTTITVVNTKIPNISKTVLSGCENLKFLNLDGEFSVQKGAFTGFKSLQSLSINGSVIHELDEAVFTGLETLKTLTVHHSKIRGIRRGAFRGIPNVKVVDLQYNEIETVPAEVFKNLPQLKVVNLADNKIKNLNWDEFQDLKNLQILFLERNEFSTINPEKLLSNVPNLERIFVSYDKLSPDSRKALENVFSKRKINVIYSGHEL